MQYDATSTVFTGLSREATVRVEHLLSGSSGMSDSAKSAFAAIGVGAVSIALAQGIYMLWTSYQQRKTSSKLEEYPNSAKHSHSVSLCARVSPPFCSIPAATSLNLAHFFISFVCIA